MSGNRNSTTLADSSGASNANSDYSRLRDNSPASLDSIPELAQYLEKLDQIHEDVREDLKKLSPYMEHFTQPNYIDSTYISNKEANLYETTRENGAMAPLLTHTYSLHSTSIDNPEALELPPPCTLIDENAVACLASKYKLP